MKDSLICSCCETVIPTETTGGLCPACLLGAALETGKAEIAEAATVRPAASGASAAPAEAGADFSDYELLEELARGGMGVVYRARHKQLNRTVALKMILAGQFASEQDVQRFYREAEAAANLDHPGIVPIYEIGEHGGQHFYSMKLIEGGSLADQMDELRGQPRAIVRLLAEVSRAVHYAHQRGILHRDLKPANILLDADGNPMITDLGLARQIEVESGITHTGAVVGTPAYMPPEQAAAKKEVTTAVDIYAIGAMLYEALTGRPPHLGPSPVETLMQVIDSQVVPARQRNRKVDRVLERICMKCLEREPNDRYTSAAAIADDLENWLAGRPISIRRISLTSTFTELIRTNMRSAIGAAAIGVLAGIALAFCISRCNSKGWVQDNPPETIYELLPATIPIGRSMFFLYESPLDRNTVLAASLGWMLIMFIVGGVVACLARPRPGTESVALGLVSGLFMAITLYTLHIGVGTVGTQESQLRTLGNLAAAAVGPASQQAAAREQLFGAFPGLQQLPAGERTRALTFRLIYDGLFRVPFGMLRGMTMTALLCVLPCFVGTTFASKLLERPTARWVRLLNYLEFMTIIVLIIIILFFAVLLPVAEETSGGPETAADWVAVAIFVALLGLVATVVYRGSFAWYWRLTLFVAIVFVALVVFA